jgi:hypothetical protein
MSLSDRAASVGLRSLSPGVVHNIVFGGSPSGPAVELCGSAASSWHGKPCGAVLAGWATWWATRDPVLL